MPPPMLLRTNLVGVTQSFALVTTNIINGGTVCTNRRHTQLLFNGAFAVGLALGHSPKNSPRFAAAAAAISVTRAGAQPSTPTFLEVMKMLDETDSSRIQTSGA
jgi:pfkB family carbohydrate kinase